MLFLKWNMNMQIQSQVLTAHTFRGLLGMLAKSVINWDATFATAKDFAHSCYFLKASVPE